MWWTSTLDGRYSPRIGRVRRPAMRRTGIWIALALLVSDIAVTVCAQESARVPDLIRKLSSSKFAERHSAMKALDTIGRPALPELRKAQSDGPDAETQNR